MDTSEKYILMCEKAEEVQKLRPLNCGDLFARHSEHSFSDNFITYLGNIRTYTRALSRHYFIDGGGIWKPLRNIPTDLLIWLPRQDQLQEMLASDEGTMESSMQQLRGFIYRLDLKRHYYKQFYKSYEQLWLAFVMREKYSKQWSEKDEEWV